MSEQQKTWIENYYDYINDGGVYPKHIQAVFDIVADMTDRRGLRQEWDNIDEDVQGEIIEKWIQIVENRIFLNN